MGKTKGHHHNEKCPCWALDNYGECAITDGGVFIPLPHHVMIFCQSSYFSCCSRYKKGCELIMNKEIGERRENRRYAKNLNIVIDVCELKKSSSLGSKYNTKTLDVSLYGMKIESPEKVLTDSIISFKLDPGFSSEFLVGTGSVKWCDKKIDSDKFEFGMVFEDTEIQKEIKKILYN
ncbi:MAG: PilZ domain-containing protein [Desulfobulbaceae bacterium]